MPTDFQIQFGEFLRDCRFCEYRSLRIADDEEREDLKNCSPVCTKKSLSSSRASTVVNDRLQNMCYINENTADG